MALMRVRKLILKCGLSPGDIVMLTAAVRDLHRCHPGKFATDVRTTCPELWENNPHLTSLSDDDPEAEEIECTYPLINQSNHTPYHCLHGFVDFLSRRLNLPIRPTAFKGDIHLSAQEKLWYSQVHEVAGGDMPFWIIAAGGKHDLTIKWWQTERYQEVVNHFKGRILFVQVGQTGHHHPKLDGVIDLRGRTNLRELVRLVYHSQGVLCSVTALMHLASAVETKQRRMRHRPCVVVAGGREPPQWEAYPHHQFIHTVGALNCCGDGGCWRDRTIRLRDGDTRDRPENLCVDVVNSLPRCMAMIEPTEVVQRIEAYFNGGVLKFLSDNQWKPAEKGIRTTESNNYDNQPLNLSSAGLACEEFLRTIPDYPDRYNGRGIVICAGGIKLFTNAWVCINMLRRQGCELPIEVWHLGKTEMDESMKALLAPLGVECVDARQIQKRFPARILNGWELKPYAIIHSKFREILLLDADNVALTNPEFLFATPEFQATGAIFWPDLPGKKRIKSPAVWRSCGMRTPPEPEFESGQIVLDKRRCWQALCLALWFNMNSDFYYQYIWGDKETYHLAFRKLQKSYSLVQEPARRLCGTMCQHDFDGRRVFQHRNNEKWDLLFNKRIRGFRSEKKCFDSIAELRSKWNGRINSDFGLRTSTSVRKRPMRMVAVMISCPERDRVRRRTLNSLRRSDWGGTPLLVFDSRKGGTPVKRTMNSAYLALQGGLDQMAEYILFLEDDLAFNRHIRHNLNRWRPLQGDALTLASLYNPSIREQACDIRSNARIVDPYAVWGGQAFLMSRDTVEHVVRHWREFKSNHDLRIPRLAGQLGKPILYHAPSLVQHTGRKSTWGGCFHQAKDFDPDWRA